MEKILLGSHIAGAIVTGGVLFVAWYRLASRTNRGRSALWLAALSVFQLLTGGLLAQTNPSVGLVCARLGIYLSIIIATELALYRARTRGELFPWRTVGGALALGVALFAITAAA